MKLFILLLLVLQSLNLAQDYCLRFYGNGVNDIDRVKIPLDNSQKMINIGESFTIEFQMKAKLSENPLGMQANQGDNDDWVYGHIIIDRDIFGSGDFGDYGISLTGGRIAFGVNNGSSSFTLITQQTIPDDEWVHVAVTRDHINGNMRIFINGILSASYNAGPTGNISYNIGRYTNFANDPYVVFGAEKHDYDRNTYPSYSGYLDNVRFSNIIRYFDNFQPVQYGADMNTVAFYDFDEGSGDTVFDKSFLSTVKSHGIRKYGGDPAGPKYVLKSLTAIEKKNKEEIKAFEVYPLPAKSFLYIKSSSKLSNLKLYDLLGREIKFQLKSESENFYVLDIRNLNSGLFLLVFDFDGKLYSQKFFKTNY